ncbi:MAG: hypothetical protein ASARMPREDX12_000912, partial [Alectoria sarmentosa]
MSPSSDSLSSTSLPFDADTHTHAAWRRSGSVPRSVQHEYQPAVHDLGPQTCSAFTADAQASDAVTRLPNAQIPPTSIESIPRSHKKALRQHRMLFWILIGIFSISLIASTAALVLGAVKAHQRGENGAKCAAIIVGVFGFSGMVGSAAVIWLVLTGRKERARLEKRWADEEKVKEARSFREREKESYVRESIKDREQSLSRSRSRGRGRDRVTRPAVTSVRATTPTPASQMPDHNTQPVSKRARSPWPSPVDFSNDIDDDPDDAIQEENDKEIRIEKDSNYNDNGNEDEKHSGQDEKVASQAPQNLRDSASTYFQDLDPSDSENEDNNNNNKESDIAILEREILSKLSLPLNDCKPPTPLADPSPPSPIPPNTHTNSHPTSPEPYNPPQQPPTHLLSPPPPNTIPRLCHGLQGSAQSDDNFLAMLDLAAEDDAGSEDEIERQRRRQRGKEKVEAWA